MPAEDHQSEQRRAIGRALLRNLLLALIPTWLFGGILLLFGLLPLLIGGVGIYQAIILVVTGESAEAVVVDMEPGDGRTLRAVFEFADSEGQTHRVTSRFSSYPPRHEVGDRVVVLYMPDDPEAATIRSFGDLWLGPLLFLVLGVGMLVVAVLLIISPWLIRRAIRRGARPMPPPVQAPERG